MRATAAAIQALPKAEVHLHIEGAIPWDIVRSRAPTVPWPPPWWEPDYRFDSFPQFLDALRRCYAPALRSPDDYFAASQRLCADLAAQNVRYVEMSFSLGHARAAGIPAGDVAAALKRAAPPGLAVRVFCGVSRSRLSEASAASDDVLAAAEVDGLSLHGDETAQGPAVFAALFAEARRRGLATKAHAGELVGPESVRATLEALHVTRIEHGVRAIEDQQLTSRLVAEGITLDVCPTSNIKLGVAADWAGHPIRRLFQRGVRVTVSTDNPAVLGCTLTSELGRLVNRCGFSLQDLAQVQRSAFQVALLSAADRARILAEIDALFPGSEDGRD